VATARPLSPEERRRLTTCLEAFVGKQLRVVFHEDAGLIGGVAFRCDDTLIDTSLRSGLTALRHRLDAAKVL
jgi:F0F1-type ATP synthase delta subunit